MALRIRRGTEAQRVGQTFDLGEIVYITDSYKLYVGDGVTAGGKNIAENLAGEGLIFDETTGTLQWAGVTYTTDDIEEGSNNKYFSNQLAQDAVGELLTNGSADNVGITFTYDDVDHKLSAEVTFPSDVVGIMDVVDDTSPSLGGNLDLNSKDITGTGNIDVDGSITATSNTITSGLINALGLAGASSSTALIRIRGSRVGYTAVVNGDQIGSLAFEAFNGSVDKKAAILQSTVNSNIVGGNFDSYLTAYVLNADGNYRPFVFRNSGIFDVLGIKLTPVNTAAIGTLTPEQGAVAFNTDVNSLQFYDGSAYRTLTNFVDVPGSATAAGKQGQFSADANYLYVCYQSGGAGSGGWIRVAKDGTW